MTLEEFALAIKNEAGKAATDEELAAFEQKIGAKLPDDLKRFLKQSGGGLVFDPPVVYLDDRGRDLRIRRMCDLAEIDRKFTKPTSYPLPRELLIIGSDSGGNSIMICTREDRLGEIFMLDHEMVAYEGDPDPLEKAEEEELVRPYSPSFTDFVGDMRIEDD